MYVRKYLGGARVASRNSSIFMKSVLRTPLYRRKGGLVPGAKSFSSSGFLHNKNVLVCDLQGVDELINHMEHLLGLICFWIRLAMINRSFTRLCYSWSKTHGCGRGWLWQKWTEWLSEWTNFICLIQTVITKVSYHRHDSYSEIHIRWALPMGLFQECNNCWSFYG